VLIVESLGREFLVDVKVAEDVLKVRVDTASMRHGDDVWMLLDMGKIHLFGSSGDLIL